MEAERERGGIVLSAFIREEFGTNDGLEWGRSGWGRVVVVRMVTFSVAVVLLSTSGALPLLHHHPHDDPPFQ
jgi:hypothetical protein